MRDPFGAQQHVHVAHQFSGEFTPVTMPSRTGYMLGNGDGESWAPTSSSLIRHQYPNMSGIRNVRDEFNNSLLDPEIEELCSRSRSQEEEILLLRKQISDASVQELQLLQEKHVLERRLSDLRMALDEKQDDATSYALKELTQRKGYIGENIRLAHDLKVAEEEVYVFTSSLLSLLAEYNIRLPLLNSSTITNNTKRLHQHMDWKIRSSGASFGEIKHKIGNQPGDMTSTIDRHSPKVSNNQLSQQHLDSRVSDFHQYKQYPAEFNVEPSSSQSRVNRNYDLMDMKGVKNAPNSDLQYKEFPSSIYKKVGGTDTPNLQEEATFEARTRRETADVQYERRASPGSDDDLTLPGIEGFQIIGEAKPGCTLRACGFPTNGTSLCNFQWVRHLENGTRQSIEGATVPDYVVTADDVDTFLAVDCIPMDDNGHQGELVSLFANNQNKITCDQDMQYAIGSHISSGRAIFPVFLLMESSETWEETSLILKRSGYQVLVNSTRHAVIEEKYSPDIYIKVPNGQSTQFELICRGGTTLRFDTSGASQAYNTDDDIWIQLYSSYGSNTSHRRNLSKQWRLRDVIVLTMRYFQSKSLQPSNNKEMKRVENSPPRAEPLLIPTTGGYGSTSQRKSEDTCVKPSFKAFSPKEIQDATNNFSRSLMIGHGGYGKVYKCQLDNYDVAVKILDDQGGQGLKEYIKEMEVLQTMRHENLIHLMGTCFKFCALIYEYLPNGSLEDCLKDRPWDLTWEIRTRIVYELCTALMFLHANNPEPLVHGDLKPHNVLLDANFKVKLADFGLSRYLTQGENSKAFHQTMHISGSAGYMDPDFLGSGKATPGIDVYSLGKTVVRILTGQYPPDIFREVYVAKKTRTFMTIVDPTVRNWPENVVEILAQFALRSAKPDRYSSVFMRNFYTKLEMILDDIGN